MLQQKHLNNRERGGYEISGIIDIGDIEKLNSSAASGRLVLKIFDRNSGFDYEIFSDYVLVVAVFLVLAFGIYGGILYITAYGNEEKATKGKNTILWAIIGALVVGIAFVLVRYFALQIMGTDASMMPGDLK